MSSNSKKLEALKRKMAASKRPKKKSGGKRWLALFILTLFGLGFGYQQGLFLDVSAQTYFATIWENLQGLPQKLEGTSFSGNQQRDAAEDEFYLPAHRPHDPMLVRHRYYTLHYNEAHEQANWVAYRLHAGYLKGDAKRPNDFRTDPKISTGSASPADYRGSGYDRGHFAPSGDFKFSQEAMSESFFMSNMSPQVHEFNAGLWHDLEKMVRHWASSKEEIYIIMGPILEPNLKKIGANQVSVPQRYFKIVCEYKPSSEPKLLAFLMPNRESYLSPENYTVTVDEIEALTGIDFFPSLEDGLEEKIESQITHAAWLDQ